MEPILFLAVKPLVLLSFRPQTRFDHSIYVIVFIVNVIVVGVNVIVVGVNVIVIGVNVIVVSD